MDSSYHGRVVSHRRALADGTNRGNENASSQNYRPKKPGSCQNSNPSSSKRPLLSQNESMVPSHEPEVPTDRRLSHVASHDVRPHITKRDSEISNASTNASNTNRRRKTHIGPWQLGKTIGKGGCSRVRLVRHSSTGQYGAAKIISKATAEKVRALSLANLIQSAKNDPSLRADGKVIPFGLEREICIMKLLDHPNIVHLYDIWENRDELYLIMEYVEGGELFNYIHEQGGLVEIQTVHIFRQIIAALMYCHRINIHHRDLKPENILLDRETMTVKLVDFGMAALQPTGRKLTTPCGSPHYAAPEVIKTMSYDGAKADVWSCGVILCVLLTGIPPFNYSGEDRHLKHLFRDIAEARYVMPDVSNEAQDLIRRILVVDPKRRIGLDGIWHHPFMRKYQNELGFVGEAATQEHWAGSLPAIEDWTTLERTTIDREILRYLRTLWHSEKEEVLIQRLMSKEANQEKYFYAALRKYHADQLENYQPSAHHCITHSNSDHHHQNVRLSPTHEDLDKLPTKRHDRSQSAYSILNNEHLYSKYSFFESPASEASYDPFRASRQPILPEKNGVRQSVVIHRSPGEDSRKLRPVTALVHRPGSSLRVQALRNNSRRSSAMSRGSSSRSTPSHHVAPALKPSSMSRSSLVSSHYPSSPPVVLRSSGLGKRGVSFSHLRNRRSSVATTSTWETEVGYGEDNSSLRTRAPIGSYGSPRPTGTARPSIDVGPKIHGMTKLEPACLKVRQPDSPTKFIHSEARKVSQELGKVMEEAFNRGSVSSSIRTGNTSSEGIIESSKFDTPPSSFVNNRSSGGSTTTTQRPLPPIPNEVCDASLQRKLVETRTEIAKRICEGDEDVERYTEVLKHLDRLIVPVVNGKRTISAPARSPEHPAPLHVIPEEVRGENGDGFDPPTPSNCSDADTVRMHGRRVVTDHQQTIRLVNQSPTHVPIIAPLNIRKRSSDGTSGGDARAMIPLPLSQPNTDINLHTDGEECKDSILDSAPASEKQNATIKKKKSAWFRRNPEEENREQDEQNLTVKKKKSTGLLQVSEQWQGLDDRIKKEQPTSKVKNDDSSKNRQTKSDSSNSSEFPMRNTHSGGAKNDSGQKKLFFGLFSKKAKDEKKLNPMQLGGLNLSSSSVFSNFDLEFDSNTNSEGTGPTGPPEVQMNWLSRFLHIKPASRTLCFCIGRGKVRQDLVRLLRDWQRFGVHGVTLDRTTNVVNARIDKKNHLKIKPVLFVIELFVVLEHGRRANLCLARFTQTRGAASSFRKVVDIVEDVCRARGMLVEDEEKKAAMMEVLA